MKRLQLVNGDAMMDGMMGRWDSIRTSIHTTDCVVILIINYLNS